MTTQPDLTMPGAVDTIDRVCVTARRSGVEQLVLLAGRGEKKAEAAAELVAASGRPVAYLDLPSGDFIAGAIADGLAAPVAHALAGMFASVLDGRNAHLGQGVHDALGHPPRDFKTFAARASSEGAWTIAMARDAG